jgi:hypothetical protein
MELISTNLDSPGWIRLYPINFRYLQQDRTFKKYDIVSVRARPARGDGRAESWRPIMDPLGFERHLPPWARRRQWLDPLVSTSMCDLREAAIGKPPGPSLGLIRPRRVLDFVCEAHPGWTPEEQGKIDAYVNQLELFGSDGHADKSPLTAPRMRGYYHWECWSPGCPGHHQSMLDWEFVAYQRQLWHLDGDQLAEALREKFLQQMCGEDRDVAFYVGNQAKRRQTFSILGVYYPRRGR